MHARTADGSAVCGAAQARLGLAEHEVFVPQSYDWGVEAQVDWYEAYADLDGERIKLQVFEMRSMAAVQPFIGRIHVRRSRLSWKRMNCLRVFRRRLPAASLR